MQKHVAPMFATLAIQNFLAMALCSAMRTDEFLGKLDQEQIIGAIREAEKNTSGEIRVFLQRGNLKGDALSAAQKQFRNLGMQKTKERNAVLIFVARARANSPSSATTPCIRSAGKNIGRVWSIRCANTFRRRISIRRCWKPSNERAVTREVFSES